MTNVALAAEESFAETIGASYMGGLKLVSEPEEAKVVVSKFEFDADFQTRIAALAMRDDEFMRRTHHLLNPDHFENIGEGQIISFVIKHYDKYKTIPSSASMINIIKEHKANKTVKNDLLTQAILARKELLKDDLKDREFFEDKLAEFARHQAVGQAILLSVNLLEKKKFAQIEEAVKKAIEIGLNEEGDVYDYYAEITNRTEQRADDLAGKLPPTGITTGIHKMDELLYHKGWGRKELVTIMGGPKTGKTTALLGFARAASMAGYSVLHATLEVSAKIASDRLDAAMSDTLMKDLKVGLHAVEAKVNAIAARSGKLNIVEFASGTLSPAMLKGLLEKHRSQGLVYDFVVVDYADIMKPNIRAEDLRENTRTIYIDLRAIAFEFNVAVLTATQTNREGHKATVAKMEHVSDDFNKARTVDLMISINRTEEEARRGEARLHFAASRNQESGFTIVIKQNLAMMKFVDSVIAIE